MTENATEMRPWPQFGHISVAFWSHFCDHAGTETRPRKKCDHGRISVAFSGVAPVDHFTVVPLGVVVPGVVVPTVFELIIITNLGSQDCTTKTV